jgi:deoxyribodipyrimidine photo-lyase
MPTPQVVWFKRDLRTQDHTALHTAISQGATLALYVLEPDLWRQPSASVRHWQLVREALDSLAIELQGLGGELCVRIGSIEQILNELQLELGHFHLHAHEETGEAWTYARDKSVTQWCSQQGVQFSEYRNFGVFRGLKDRDGWARRWRTHMRTPITSITQQNWLTAASTADWQAWQPELPGERITITPGLNPQLMLDDFLTHRGERYHLEMSSPNTAPLACSRLSTLLAAGRLSMRQVVQQTWATQAEVKSRAPEQKGTWPKALAAFQSRLHWHCHFIQKFESEPAIELQNMARSCDGLRENDFNKAHFDAWCKGETGFPFVDACMRYLNATGWINFRMRAMLVSFASYDLWLHWRQPALHLARLFADYEPGIHFSQTQMQSGTTGINTLRIYNPLKQSTDQDPDGHFIRTWVPELARLSGPMIHTPWLATQLEQIAAGCVIGQDYPEPIVDHAEASRNARSRFSAVRASAAGKTDRHSIVARHGSRKGASRK